MISGSLSMLSQMSLRLEQLSPSLFAIYHNNCHPGNYFNGFLYCKKKKKDQIIAHRYCKLTLLLSNPGGVYDGQYWNPLYNEKTAFKKIAFKKHDGLIINFIIHLMGGGGGYLK